MRTRIAGGLFVLPDKPAKTGLKPYNKTSNHKVAFLKVLFPIVTPQRIKIQKNKLKEINTLKKNIPQIVTILFFSSLVYPPRSIVKHSLV